MEVVKPRIARIAATRIEPHALRGIMPHDPESNSEIEELTTFAGRACYQSFHRPNPATAKDSDYIARTLHGQNHWSIAEHATATYYVEGVSRAFTHELIRHRHLSFSQLSQRFVDESDPNIVIPPALRGSEWLLSPDHVFGAPLDADRYQRLVDKLRGAEFSRKQAREAARAVLPNMVETRIVVTGNMRAWHEVIDRRSRPDADAEMQEVMGMILDDLVELAPNIFNEE